jgi:hypothetical protein
MNEEKFATTLRGQLVKALPDCHTRRPKDHGAEHPRRTCSECGARLSRYSPEEDRCWLHREPREPGRRDHIDRRYRNP